MECPPDLTKLSFSSDELSALKREAVGDRPYADRVSLGMVLRLLSLRVTRREDHLVLDELDFLEGATVKTKAKREEQFREPPLHPFWHKHYSAPRHLLRNIGDRLGLRGDGAPVIKIASEAARSNGNDPSSWPGVLVHRLVFDAFEKSAKRGLSGDWIVFAKYGGKNYYLDLATHEEGHEAAKLYRKLRASGAAEFPFLFKNEVF